MSIEKTIPALSPAHLANLGAEQIAYIKPCREGDQMIFEVHAANGEELARVDDRTMAEVLCRQNELMPLSVH